jgi:hypothetical protein
MGIEQWRKDREQLDKEAAVIRNHIESSPNRDKYSPGRAKLRILLNYLCVQRQRVNEKIKAHEDEEELARLFQGISGLDETMAVKLMRDMERLNLIKAGLK